LPYFTDPLMRQFVQRANRGGRVIARHIGFETGNLAEILKINGAKHIDELVTEVDHHTGKYIRPKILHPKTSKLVGDDYHFAWDATSLYAAAMALIHATYLDAPNAMVLTEE